MKELFSLAMDIGEQMLICGAEVSRAEESIMRMCKAFGARRIDVFVITSHMQATFYTDEESYTQSRRIRAGGTDFEKLHQLNELSRKICEKNPTEEEIRRDLNSAMAANTYPFWLECLCYAAIAGAFTLFFGGGIIEALISLIIGAVVRIAMLFSDKYITNKIFAKFYSSVVATALAFISFRIGLVAGVDKIIIGNIMTLIPGVGLTNALRDLFIGDSIAGLLRSIEAALIALAIAAGYFTVAFLGGAAL